MSRWGVFRPNMLVFGVACTLWLLTCQPHDTFDVSQIAQAHLSPGSSTHAIAFDGFDDIKIVANPVIKEQGVTPGAFVSVKPAFVTVRVVVPDNGQDLAFISQMDFYLAAPNLPRLLFASASQLPKNEALAHLDVQDAELLKYFQASSMQISVETSMSSSHTALTLEANVSFQVSRRLFR